MRYADCQVASLLVTSSISLTIHCPKFHYSTSLIAQFLALTVTQILLLRLEESAELTESVPISFSIETHEKHCESEVLVVVLSDKPHLIFQ